MILPRRLFRLDSGETPPYQFCEEDDPKQAMNFRPKGYYIADPEAERIGLIDYLNETGWGETAKAPGERKVTRRQAEKQAEEESEAEHEAEAESKAVAQSEVEDKAVSAKDAEEKHAAAKSDESKPKEETTGTGLHIEPEHRRGGTGGRRS
jgi:hypothetical protein